MVSGTSAGRGAVSSGSSRSPVTGFFVFSWLLDVVRGLCFCGSFCACAKPAVVTMSSAAIASAMSVLFFVISTSNPEPGKSLGATPKQNDLDRLKQDDRVKHQTMVLDVEKIVLQLLSRIRDRRAVRILDLRPAGQSRRDQMALFVVRNLLGELGHKVRALRPRADETHFAAQDVPELRNLVDARFAQDATDARRAIVAFTGPHRTVRFRVYSHRTKLEQGKRPAVLADSLLLVKDWTTRVELDENRSQNRDRQRQQRANQRRQTMHERARKRR